MVVFRPGLRPGLMLFILWALLLQASCSPRKPQVTQHLTIVHTNDIEGALDPCSCASNPSGGTSRRATALQELRGGSPELLLLDAGDALFGAPVSNATAGQVQVAVMNALGYDAAVIGDRDFLYGLDVLLKGISAAKFPFLSANIVWAEDGQPITQASAIVEKRGLRIAILGLTTPNVEKLWSADLVVAQKLRLLDPIETAQELVPELKKSADAVVILSHLGQELDSQLARKVSGITAIVGGHSRQLIDPPELLAGNVPLVQVGYQGDVLGVLELDVNQDGHQSNTRTANIKLTSDFATDRVTSALIAHYKAVAVLSADLPLSTVLVSDLPLEVHRASKEAQKAYIIAMAFPEQLAEEFASVDSDLGQKSLLSCFIQNGPVANYQFEYSLIALQEPTCIERALAILPELPLQPQPFPVIQSYWDEGDGADRIP